MQPYINEALAAERVRSLHEEGAARRLARAARAARPGHQGGVARLAIALRRAPRRARAARPATESPR